MDYYFTSTSALGVIAGFVAFWNLYLVTKDSWEKGNHSLIIKVSPIFMISILSIIWHLMVIFFGMNYAASIFFK